MMEEPLAMKIWTNENTKKPDQNTIQKTFPSCMDSFRKYPYNQDSNIKRISEP